MKKALIFLLIAVGFFGAMYYYAHSGADSVNDDALVYDTPSETETVSDPEEAPGAAAGEGSVEQNTDIAEPTEKPLPPSETVDYASLSNKSEGWGFKKNKGAEPDIYESTKKLLEKYDAYYMDQQKPKRLYLTFDEGYENGYTSAILDTLKKCEVRAAFFVTGPYVKKETELMQRMIDEGHIVGNHTVNHPRLPELETAEKMKTELEELNKTVAELYGYDMRYMRPPEGEYSERVLAAARDSGFKTIFWSFAYRDWDTTQQRGAEYAYEQVTPYLHDGAILLLHAVSSDNAAALEDIINYAKSQGYTFSTLDEL